MNRTERKVNICIGFFLLILGIVCMIVGYHISNWTPVIIGIIVISIGLLMVSNNQK